jgi:peptidoglycan/xylan/chitin deacetylase (PgdA/CDA1 family)
LSEEDFRIEVSEGIAKLQAATGKPIHHFAYPYGSPNEIGEREYRLISEFNFKTAFIAYGGCITEDNILNITHLPRVYLHEQ